MIHQQQRSVPALPTAAEPFIRFASVLREHRFSVAPDQTRLFIEAVGVLGPRSMRDIHAAARATLAPPIERRDEFDALYRLVFLGHSQAAGDTMADDDELQAFDERDGSLDSPEASDSNEVGEQASSGEVLSLRRVAADGDDAVLRRFSRAAPTSLPHRQTLRRRASRRGRDWDMRRSLRDAVRRDGELLQIPRRQRRSRQRCIVLLIDVSGSMKAQTDAYLRFAHVLVSVSEQCEVFTIGTRLTRVSRTLRVRQRDRALALAGTLVADWDGGTRLGDALDAFLGIPRFAGFARSALVVVLSDGLERGDHDVLVQSVERLARLAWRLLWLTPLAADAQSPVPTNHSTTPGGGSGSFSSGTSPRHDFEPRTAAMRAIEPVIDELGSGASTDAVCRHLLQQARGPVARSKPVVRARQVAQPQRGESRS